MATANQGERKTKGRQKIDIKKIENKRQLHVTFSKRRKGIFKKAQELHLRTGAEIAVFVRSLGNKIFAFGSPSTDSVIDHYINSPNSHEPAKRKKPMAPITEEDGATGEEFGGSTLDLLHGFDTGPITQEGGGGGMGDFGGNNNDVALDLHCGLGSLPITEEGEGSMGTFGASNNDVTLDLLRGLDSGPNTQEQEAATNVDDCMYPVDSLLLL